MRTLKLSYETQEECDLELGKSTDGEGVVRYASWVKALPVYVPNITTPDVIDDLGEVVTPAVYGSEILVDVLIGDDYNNEAGHAITVNSPLHRFSGVD